MKKRGILLIGAICLTGLLACQKPEEKKVVEVPAPAAPAPAAPAMSKSEATTGAPAAPGEAAKGGEQPPAGNLGE